MSSSAFTEKDREGVAFGQPIHSKRLNETLNQQNWSCLKSPVSNTGTEDRPAIKGITFERESSQSDQSTSGASSMTLLSRPSELSSHCSLSPSSPASSLISLTSSLSSSPSASSISLPSSVSSLSSSPLNSPWSASTVVIERERPIAGVTDKAKRTKVTSSSKTMSPSGKSFTSSAKHSGKRNTYKHVPHCLKPAHLVAKRNARERTRVQAVNSAFGKLRKHVPYEAKHKRLSKVKTLRLAIEYIHRLQDLIHNHDRQQALAGRCPVRTGVATNESPATSRARRRAKISDASFSPFPRGNDAGMFPQTHTHSVLTVPQFTRPSEAIVFSSDCLPSVCSGDGAEVTALTSSRILTAKRTIPYQTDNSEELDPHSYGTVDLHEHNGAGCSNFPERSANGFHRINLENTDFPCSSSAFYTKSKNHNGVAMNSFLTCTTTIDGGPNARLQSTYPAFHLSAATPFQHDDICLRQIKTKENTGTIHVNTSGADSSRNNQIYQDLRSRPYSNLSGNVAERHCLNTNKTQPQNFLYASSNSGLFGQEKF